MLAVVVFGLRAPEQNLTQSQIASLRARSPGGRELFAARVGAFSMELTASLKASNDCRTSQAVWV